KTAYLSNAEVHTRLDAARLIALLESHYPDGLGWRSSQSDRLVLPQKLPRICVDALHAASIHSAYSLLRTLRSRRCKGFVRSFAGIQGITPAEVSHLALVILAVASKSKGILRRFPELLTDTRTEELVYGKKTG